MTANSIKHFWFDYVRTEDEDEQDFLIEDEDDEWTEEDDLAEMLR